MSVSFRELQPADSASLLSWRNSPHVAAYMYTGRLIEQAEHDAWFSAIPGDPRRAYWVILIDEEPAGLVNLYDITPEHRRASWGYYLAEPRWRGKGVGAYVQYRLLRYAFEGLALQKLWCEVLNTNLTALNLYLSFGFQREALFRRHILRGDTFFDVTGLGLLTDEWPQIRPGSEQRLAAAGFNLPAGPHMIGAQL